MAEKRIPAALARATGIGMTFNAATLNVTPIHNTFDDEMHHTLRLARLRRRHGLNGPLAATIANLCYDGGRR